MTAPQSSTIANRQSHISPPPGYKSTKLGPLPVEWEVVRLGEVTKVNQGLQIAISNRLKVSCKDSELYITVQYLNGNKPAEWVKDAKGSVKCEPDDILMTRTGNTGMVVTGAKGVFHNNFFKINIDSKRLFRDYLLLYLKSPKTQHQILAQAGSSTIPDLNHGDFYFIPIPLPPLPEQRAIAAVLATWDRAHHALTQLLDAKRRQKRGLMQRLLTGEVRVPGYDSKWKFKKLGELLDYEQPTKYLVDNTEYSDQYDIPVLTPGKTFILGYTSEKQGIYDKPPVILFDDFTTASRYIRFPFKVKSSAVKLLSLKNKSGSLEFIYGRMQLIPFDPTSHKRYWISEYSELDIKIPSSKEQRAIAAILTTADREIELLEAELDALKEQKRGLMQRLLTGQVRVGQFSSEAYRSNAASGAEV